MFSLAANPLHELKSARVTYLAFMVYITGHITITTIVYTHVFPALFSILPAAMCWSTHM